MDHLERLRNYDDAFGAEKGKNVSTQERSVTIEQILKDLALLQRNVSGARDRLSKAEAMMNVKGSIARLSSEYGSHKSELERLENIVNDKTAKISVLGDNLASVSERLAEVKEEMEDKYGHLSGDGGADTGGGTHEVIRYRTALQRMKDDVNTISLSVGITQALLMTKRQQHSKERGAERSNKARRRRMQGKQRRVEEKSLLD